MLCNKCGKEIKDESKFCNYCGANQEDQQNKNANLSIFLIVCFIFIVGIIGSFAINKNQNGSIKTSKSDLKVLDSSFCQLEYGSKGICGTILNDSTKTYKYVNVKFNIYDENENNIGIASANKNNLEPHNKWKFEAPISENNVKSYKMDNITSF